MRQSNFSPVVVLILGCVPFLLMVVQWGTEDIVGIERAIDYMTRWEVIFQIGIEMFLLGVILWCLDRVKEFIRIRKWRMEFIKDWQSNYKELDEEAAQIEHIRHELAQMNKEVFMRGCLCQPLFDEETRGLINKDSEYLGVPKSTRTQWSEDRTDNGTIIISRLPTYSARVCTLWPSEPRLRTNNGAKF